MDKLFITKKQEKLKVELQETKAKMQELFKKVLHSFEAGSREYKVVNRLYDSFKKKTTIFVQQDFT
jgi:hypothetical protein